MNQYYENHNSTLAIDSQTSAQSGTDSVSLTHIKHGDLDGDDVARLVGRLGVVLLAERHDVDTLGTKRRADGRRRRRLAGFEGQLYKAYHCRTTKGLGARTSSLMRQEC